MNNKILLAIAIISGLIAMFLVQRHISEIRGETITVFKATQDRDAGDVMGSTIETVTLPAGLFPDALEEAPDENFREYIESTPLRIKVTAGDILLFRHFDSSVDPGVLPSIPAGKKALSLTVNQASSVSYFVQPGDFVDVMGTFPAQRFTTAQEDEKIDYSKASTRPLVQAVQVLAVGSEYRASERQSLDPYASVTLLVDMEEAAKLIFAQDYYEVDFTLILRGKDDTDIANNLPEVGIGTHNFDDIGNVPSNKLIMKKEQVE
ncbi:MAG: Flp pilus assembly protein CpaB [Halioglobus sp.]